MSFESILQSILDESGGLGIALMGGDGIPVAEIQCADNAEETPGGDIGAAGAEFGRILDEIRKASDALGGGAVTETVVTLARFSLIFQTVDDDLFVVLALPADGNLGRSRYLIRRQLLAIRFEL